MKVGDEKAIWGIFWQILCAYGTRAKNFRLIYGSIVGHVVPRTDSKLFQNVQMIVSFNSFSLNLKTVKFFHDSGHGLQEKQFKSIRILLAESEAAVHVGLIIFLRTFINNQLSKGVWVKRNYLYIRETCRSILYFF